MFKTFFTSELRYVLRQPTIYIYIVVFAVTEFLTIALNSGASESVFRNAPIILNRQLLQLSFIGLLITFTFFNNAALRDYKSNFNEILFTTPLHKHGYFFGRFFAALLLATLPFIGAYIGLSLGILISPILGWASADRFGPFYIETFVNNYFIFILPTTFVTGSIIYALASRWKSIVISFLGILLFIVINGIANSFTSSLHSQTIGGLFDILGINTYAIETSHYTTLEKNTINPTLSGIVLWNRVIWISLGSIILFISYITFSFKKRNQKRKKQKNKSDDKSQILLLPKVSTHYNKKTTWLQFKSFFMLNFLSITKSIAFKILLFFILFSGNFGSFVEPGIEPYPLTYTILDGMASADIFLNIILIFFSGELIWRDRNSNINEIIDATAHTSFISMIAKTLSLVSILSILNLVLILFGIAYQLFNGFTSIEIDLYLLDFLYSNLPRFIIYSGVMVLIQVVLNNRYIAYFVSILVIFALGQFLNLLGLTTNMLNISSGSSIQYSDLNSFGPGLKGALWFNAYWLLFSLLCLLIAGSLWNRGLKKSLLKRFTISRKQTPKNYRISIIVTITIWLLVSGYVYYNTQVLNPYLSTDAQTQLIVNYEKKYKQYEHILLPKITSIKYAIDIFPSQRNVDAKATITLTNENTKPIDELHFVLNNDWEIELDIPNSKLITKDVIYSIYKLDTSLKPGTSIQIKLDAKYRTRGFENDRGETNIVKNGTMISNRDFVPFIGYQDRFELSNNSIRKEYGLSEKIRTDKLTKDVSKNHMKNALGGRTSEFFNVETIISTSSDQTAIASGSLIKQWKKEDRNYYHYKTDTPSINGHNFNSGRFEIAKRQWNDVAIEVYYDKKHPKNIQRMLDVVVRSLSYYTKNFGSYYHKHFRIIEVPRYVRFNGEASTGGTMLYNEAAGFIMNIEDETKNNPVDAIVAHEIAHQWWAHQITGANLQGRAMLHEGLAEYSTLMVLKEAARNTTQMQQFLENDHEFYLRGRSRETRYESPLYKVEHQNYVRYGKGSVIFYALQDYIGEEKVNTALKDFIDAYGYKKPPYPSTLNFLDYLEPQIPDSLNYILKDWFKEITLYDNLMKNTTYQELENGKYMVTMEIDGNKIKADNIGNETRVEMNDWIDIGFFLDEDEKILHYQKRIKIHKGLNKFTFELDTLPVKAAIDPGHLLIDKNYDDNIRVISEITN